MGGNIPVEGGQRVQAQPFFDPGDGSEVEIFWGYPSNPIEKTERAKNRVRKP